MSGGQGVVSPQMSPPAPLIDTERVLCGPPRSVGVKNGDFGQAEGKKEDFSTGEFCARKEKRPTLVKASKKR